MREVGIVRNFPEKAVGIGEVAGVPLKFRSCPATLHQASSAGRDFAQESVDLISRAHIVRQRESRERIGNRAARDGQSRIGGKVRPGVERQVSPAHLKKRYRGWRFDLRQT